MKINENKLATDVTDGVVTNQGRKGKDISVAQVKAVVAELRRALSGFRASEIMEWIERG